MKERMQKTLAEVKGCPQKDRTESEGYVGAQTFMWICEDNIVEVPFDKEKAKMKARLKELTSRSNGWGYAKRTQKLEEYIKGWVGYYHLANMKRFLIEYAEPHVRWCERSENESRRKTTSFSSYSILLNFSF